MIDQILSRINIVMVTDIYIICLNSRYAHRETQPANPTLPAQNHPIKYRLSYCNSRRLKAMVNGRTMRV